MSEKRLKLGFTAGAIDVPGSTDAELYHSMLEEVEFAAGLGFDSAWMIEHHFVDYYPTPNPLVGLSHIAGRHPELELGTSVLVTPWHHPLRLAEDIAMLSQLTDRQLHMGMGRGTAKYEYDAFGLDMSEARERFAETLEIVRQAFTGEKFTHSGKHFQFETPVQLRPVPDPSQISIYGAIGSSSSASIMGDAGVPPICTSVGSLEDQQAAIDTWREHAPELAASEDLELPIMINCIVADSDKEAIAQAREHMPRFMQAQIDHYQLENTDWTKVKGYEQWANVAKNFKRLTIPENIDGWTTRQLIGSAETVKERIDELTEIGFNHIILQCATPGVPLESRRDWMTRFVTEVAAPARRQQAASV
ncbi:MAG TPA: LLM class flavin-dependent oxidoreductase [Solirubrobacterales bacterium]|nr:LLM class flavin-dependent oxidoreductase [Solirubrobacterales bacterium]